MSFVVGHNACLAILNTLGQKHNGRVRSVTVVVKPHGQVQVSHDSADEEVSMTALHRPGALEAVLWTLGIDPSQSSVASVRLECHHNDAVRVHINRLVRGSELPELLDALRPAEIPA